MRHKCSRVANNVLLIRQLADGGTSAPYRT